MLKIFEEHPNQVAHVTLGSGEKITGSNIFRELTDTVGTIRVTKVDDGSSEATIISGSGFEVGDVVENQ